MTDKFTNGTWTITEIEYGPSDYVMVEDYGKAPIKSDMVRFWEASVEINGIDYPLDTFKRIKGA